MKRIAILGHWGGNIGHDFMAEGVMNIANEALLNERFQIVTYEQHKPFSIYNNFLDSMMSYIKAGHGNGSWIKKFLNRENISEFLWKKYSGHLSKFNIAISVGGPNIVRNASADMHLLLHHMPGSFFFNKVPVLSLSNGSCFPLENIPNQLDPDNARFWQRALGYCKVTTVRDYLARKLLRSVGYDAPLIPCPALLSGLTFEKMGKREKEYIVINYQKKGANEDWGQGVDENQWRKTIEDTVITLQRNHKILFVCHNPTEVKIAKRLNIKNTKVFYPTTLKEYADVILSAKVGLVSRIHAAFALAGIGVPSVVIGTDTRLETVKLIGLETLFVKKATSKELVDKIEHLMKISNAEEDRLHTLKQYVKDTYIKIINENIKG